MTENFSPLEAQAVAVSSSVTALESHGRELVQQAQAMAITDAASYGDAVGFARLVKAYLAEVDAFMGPICEQAHAAWKTAVGRRDGLKRFALDAERVIKGALTAWTQEQERLRREAEETARRERERLEGEERERVAAEQRRLQAEAEERRLLEALAAEQRGDVQAAAKLLDAPVVTPPVAPRPVFAPPAAVAPAPKAEGVWYREEWDFEVVEPGRVPREYLRVDEVALRAVVKALRGKAQIPGVRVFVRTVAAVRR